MSNIKETHKTIYSIWTSPLVAVLKEMGIIRSHEDTFKLSIDINNGGVSHMKKDGTVRPPVDFKPNKGRL